MKYILAIGQSLLSLIGISFIGIVFYSELTSPYNWIVSIIFFLLAIFISIRVYRMIIRRGYISTIAGAHSSYDADDLKPTLESGVLQLNPDQLEHYFDNGKIAFESGTVAIWGDWQGRQLNNKHKFSSIEFDSENKILSIHFTDFSQLQIKDPSIIHYSDSYIKILKAKEIRWQIMNEDLVNEQYFYLNNGKSIQTNSNTTWKPRKEDLGIGMNALYIQG